MAGLALLDIFGAFRQCVIIKTFSKLLSKRYYIRVVLIEAVVSNRLNKKERYGKSA